MDQSFSACFVWKFALQSGEGVEKGGSANFKIKCTEPLGQGLTPPLRSDCIIVSTAVARRASPLAVLGDLGAVAEAGAVRRRPLRAVRVHATRSVLVCRRRHRKYVTMRSLIITCNITVSLNSG